MQLIRVPVSELIAYLDDTLPEWPRGYNVEPKGPERQRVLTHAATEFAQAYILASLQHVRKKPDPMRALMLALGYPLANMSEEDLDDLEVEADDQYLNLTVTFDSVVDVVRKHTANRLVTFEVPDNAEDILVHIHGDVVLERYREMLRKVKRMTPPKVVSELDDLEEVSEYIDHCVSEVFKNINHPTVREEVKRIYMEAVKRQ